MCINRSKASANFGNGNSGNLVNTDIVDANDISFTDSDDTDINEALAGYDMDDPSIDEPLELFNEYMWMENEQEFEQEEIRRLEEEELTIQCLIAMTQLSLLDEIIQVQDEQHKESVLTDIAQKSSLNPFAEEFIPAEPDVINI